MSVRGLVVLAIAAILAVGAALWLSGRRAGDGTPSAGAPVLAGARAQINDFTEVRLSRGKDKAATLTRGKDGWMVGERGYPADAGKVRKLLIDLTGLEVVEEKTRDPASYAQLGVEDVKDGSAGGVLVELTAPEKKVGLIVGKSAGMHASYVRVAGEPLSVMAKPALSVEPEPQRWLDLALVDVDAARAQRIEVTPAKGPAWTLERSARGGDFTIAKLPRGREAAGATTLAAVAGVLHGLQLEDVAAAREADKGAAKPARFVLTTFDGLVVELTGRNEGDKPHVALAARFDPAAAKRFPADAKDGEPAADAQKEAAVLAARGANREFEIASWKYDAIFRPLEELLKPK